MFTGATRRASASPSEADPSIPLDRRLRKPVTIVGGFLGAGKTTLVNHILSQPHGLRIAVIINEFGSVGVDDRLIVGGDRNIRLMANGCICCTAQTSLYWTLTSLYSRCDRLGTGEFSWRDVDFCHVLIEPSGLSQPEAVAQMFFLEGLRERYRLDCFVTVVDAQYGILSLDEHAEAREQAVFADVILLNKVDLAEARELPMLEARLRALNPLARIYRTRNTAVPLDRIMGVGLFDRALKPPAHEPPAGDAGSALPHHWHGAEDRIRAVALVERRPLSKEKVNRWINDLFVRHGDKILRSKGVLCFAGHEHRFVFQGVRKSFHSRADRLWTPQEDRESVVVLIGEGFDDVPALESAFRDCVA